MLRKLRIAVSVFFGLLIGCSDNNDLTQETLRLEKAKFRKIDLMLKVIPKEWRVRDDAFNKQLAALEAAAASNPESHHALESRCRHVIEERRKLSKEFEGAVLDLELRRAKQQLKVNALR